MNSLNSARRLSWVTPLLMWAVSTGCADRLEPGTTTPNDTAKVRTNALEASSATIRVKTIEKTGTPHADNQTFDVTPEGASATVIGLFHNVLVDRSGDLHIVPTPSVDLHTGEAAEGQDWSYQMRLAQIGRDNAMQAPEDLTSMRIDGSRLDIAYSGGVVVHLSLIHI